MYLIRYILSAASTCAARRARAIGYFLCHGQWVAIRGELLVRHASPLFGMPWSMKLEKIPPQIVGLRFAKLLTFLALLHGG